MFVVCSESLDGRRYAPERSGMKAERRQNMWEWEGDGQAGRGSWVQVSGDRRIAATVKGEVDKKTVVVRPAVMNGLEMEALTKRQKESWFSLGVTRTLEGHSGWAVQRRDGGYIRERLKMGGHAEGRCDGRGCNRGRRRQTITMLPWFSVMFANNNVWMSCDSYSNLTYGHTLLYFVHYFVGLTAHMMPDAQAAQSATSLLRLKNVNTLWMLLMTSSGVTLWDLIMTLHCKLVKCGV